MQSIASRQLRDELDTIASREMPPAAAKRAIDRLRKDHPHSVVFEDAGSTNADELCNCFTHAFGVCDQLRGPHHQPDSAFVAELIAEGHLQEIADADARDGVISMHFVAADRPEHAGVVQADQCVVSKWGPTGHVWRHPVCEVPASYGEEIRFFRRPDPEDILRRFSSYDERRIARGKAGSGDRP